MFSKTKSKLPNDGLSTEIISRRMAMGWSLVAASNVLLFSSAFASNHNNLVQMSDGRLLAPDIARIVNRGEIIVGMLKVDTPGNLSKPSLEV